MIFSGLLFTEAPLPVLRWGDLKTKQKFVAAGAAGAAALRIRTERAS